MIAGLAEIVGSFPWLLPAFAFGVGAMVGSFLNVVIIRIPAGESVIKPGSHCACGQPIAWRDNVPILSWLLLRGRARCCGRPFSVRYPVIELLTALLFLACARHFDLAVMACGWVLVSGLIAATFIDLDSMFIPDALTIGLAGTGLLLSILVPALHGEHSGFFALDSMRSGADALEGLLIGSSLVLWIALVGGVLLKKEAMGFGDVKFVGGIGAFIGWHGAVFAIFGGAIAGVLWFLLAVVWNAGKAKPSLRFGMQLPFGPMLAFAGAAYFLFLHGRVDAWFASFSDLF